MTSHQPSEPDSGTVDSVTSSPRSDYQLPPPHRLHEDLQPRVRFMCSFGGRIIPRPHDNQLRYVGGDTRIVVVNRTTTFSGLLTKLSKLSGTPDITVKYQLPNEDLDALISVSTDEDVDNMMEEYDRLAHGVSSKTARLRLFLYPVGDGSGASSLSSLLDGSSKREHWFLDALNSGAGDGGGSPSATASLDRGRSEASSIVSEVPDYLFGLENSEEPREPKLKNRPVLAENVSVSDPGSPARAITSSYSAVCSPSITDLPPIKTRPENPIPAVYPMENQLEGFAKSGDPSISQQTGYSSNPMWHYLPESQIPAPVVQPMPIYYVPGQVPVPVPVPAQVQAVPMQAQYMQRLAAPASQIPVRFHHQIPQVSQFYGGEMKAVNAYEYPARVISDGLNQQVYYEARNAGMVPAYPATVVSVGDELQGTGTEMKIGRVSQ
ncbi:hypothetical protein HHK36_002007 [Tetracentron sinense]|uniref:PB1 domain-containing protein n=1 Tax=Tetracentron sinense TaxID=13715 RepID=A0A834ZUN6_TETSI|nr:hypothetical protein HHK36_002007 [Tetracentron sinense]